MNNTLFQIPKPILLPDYGPSAGGTKLRIENLSFDNSSNLLSTMKVFLGKNQCHITEYDRITLISPKIHRFVFYRITSGVIECINQACTTDHERLDLSVQVNGQLWQIEKTYFQCRPNPVILDWSPRKSIIR
jgi:hypothetical protein